MKKISQQELDILINNHNLYVFYKIMRSDVFNAVEKFEAQKYIFKVRNGYWAPKNWKGYD